VTPDFTPPSVPTGFAGVPTETTIALSWTPSTNSGGETSYEVFLNGNLLATTALTAYTVTGLTAGTEYVLAVAAVDAAGNHSDAAQIHLATLPRTPPTPTAVAQTGAEAVKIYPNPAKKTLHIANSGGYTIVQLVSLEGAVLYARPIAAGNSTVNVSFLSPGTYFVRLSAPKIKPYTAKIVISD
jgi:hypothetical protein